MRYATVRRPDGTTRGAVLDGDELTLVDRPDAAAAAAAGDTAGDGERIPVDVADLGPPSVTPRKIFCVGLNYETHIREMGRDLPTHPTLFAKFALALVGPHDPIRLPRVSQQIDWEAELAAVVGRPARFASYREARDAIAGYTACNEITARDLQWRTKQWLAGKTLEGSTPLGPHLVTPDEVDHAADLEIRCEVDGEVMQQARTSDLVFDAAAVVSYVSEIITLEPGDVILTGTPGGVGAGRDPQVFLREGQIVTTAIEGIGTLTNVCRAEERD